MEGKGCVAIGDDSIRKTTKDDPYGNDWRAVSCYQGPDV